MIEVVDYNSEWPDQFCRLRDRIWAAVSDFVMAIEHVGSTSVPSLAAKPVIDLDIVIRSRNAMPMTVAQLGRIGYESLGNLGIEDREAFSTPAGQRVHNLYVCLRAWRCAITLRSAIICVPIRRMSRHTGS